MRALNRIVVGIDFSTHSHNALSQAVRLAQHRSSQLYVAHVVESLVLHDLAEALGKDLESLRSRAIDETRQRLEALLEKIGSAAAPNIEIVVRLGNPFHEILKLVEETSADLLVLGSRDSLLAQSLLTTRCVRKCHSKVLLVRSAHTDPFAKVSAFVDFSSQTPSVVRQAVNVAQLDGSKLQVCHVFLPPWKVVHYRAPSHTVTPEAQEKYRQKLLDKLHGVLEPLEQEARGLEVEFKLVESAEREAAIEDYVQENEVDLVVISTKGRTGLRVILLGSVAEHIVQTSPCSVLVIKPHGFRFDLDHSEASNETITTSES